MLMFTKTYGMIFSGPKHNVVNQSTAKRLASMFWYLISSKIDTLHNTINGYGIPKWVC